jgi:aspartyl-tRNA(Asn)/glutamyl-tRNA(Gln) amidotransferase subunit B
VEVKNLNSFNFMAKAIDYEIKAQTRLWKKGERIIQETRGWDSVKNKTFSTRSKEEAHDYRYLPEPDLPPFDLSDKSFIDLDEIRASVPEMPWATRERFISEFGITESAAASFAEDMQFARVLRERRLRR